MSDAFVSRIRTRKSFRVSARYVTCFTTIKMSRVASSVGHREPGAERPAMHSAGRETRVTARSEPLATSTVNGMAPSRKSSRASSHHVRENLEDIVRMAQLALIQLGRSRRSDAASSITKKKIDKIGRAHV